MRLLKERANIILPSKAVKNSMTVLGALGRHASCRGPSPLPSPGVTRGAQVPSPLLTPTQPSPIKGEGWVGVPRLSQYLPLSASPGGRGGVTGRPQHFDMHPHAGGGCKLGYFGVDL